MIIIMIITITFRCAEILCERYYSLQWRKNKQRNPLGKIQHARVLRILFYKVFLTQALKL